MAAPYAAPWWLPGGHLQTIWPALQGRRKQFSVAYTRARWNTPDQDFIDVDWLVDAGQSTGASHPRRPLLVLFHGLEGTSQSHYARAFAAHAQRIGWRFAVPHFRGCSGEINRAPRAYHSGDFEEIEWILKRLRREHEGPLFAVGVSLGGNALLRWAEESGASASQLANAIAAVCSPIDLTACGLALGRGLNRLIYTPMFLDTMKPKALKKWDQHPGLFSKTKLQGARTLYEFDDVFTAPLHGYKNADDYWRRASAMPHLQAIRTPTLIVHARNDPFVPAQSLPIASDMTSYVTLLQTLGGGHVGYASANPRKNMEWLPRALAGWLSGHLT